MKQEQYDTEEQLKAWCQGIDFDQYDCFMELLEEELSYQADTNMFRHPLTHELYHGEQKGVIAGLITYLAREWNQFCGFTQKDWDFISTLPYHIDFDLIYTEQEKSSYQADTENSLKDYRQSREQATRFEEKYLKKYTSGFCLFHKKKKRAAVAERMEKDQAYHAAFYKAYHTLCAKAANRERITWQALAKEAVYANQSLFRDVSKKELEKKAKEFLHCTDAEKRALLNLDQEKVFRVFDESWVSAQKRTVLNVFYTLSFLNCIWLIIRYLFNIIFLDRVIVSNHLLYILLSVLVPFLTWIALTTTKTFDFNHTKKFRFFVMALLSAMAALGQPVYTLVWDVLVTSICSIQTNAWFTPGMVVMIARACEIVICGLFFWIMAKFTFPFIFTDEYKEKIKAFKIEHHVDTRKDREYQYDFKCIWDIDEGSRIITKENDLYTHTLLNGSSGTGKTSSVIVPQIIENIRTREQNLDYQQRRVLEMCRDEKVYITTPFTRDLFSKDYFKVVNEKYQKEFDAIFQSRRTCGITVIAPNSDIGDQIIQYCSRRGIWVNNIDPEKRCATYPYERLCGMNPLQLPTAYYEISAADKELEEERTISIAEKANNLADTLTAINELGGGSGDQYFTDVNTTVTRAVASVCQLYASIKKRQTNIDEVYLVIMSFEKLVPMVEEIERFFQIHVDVPKKEGKNSKQEINVQLPTIGNADNKGRDEKKAFLEEQREQQLIEEQIYNQLSGELQKNPYIRTLITVKNRLTKGSQMDQHAEGLRNLLGKILQDPRVERVLVKNEDSIDFDDILSKGEITVVNTALKFGASTSTCFGQLFILNFNTAVLRRPVATRIPHFFYEDECPRYLSDILDLQVTLWRQYKVAALYAIQSLQLLDKVPSLRYLKSVLLSCGTIITFGRTSYEDAEIISKLGGQTNYLMEQETTSSASFFSDDPHTGHSVRTTPNVKNIYDPHHIRYRDFQEVTIITTDNGRPLPARHGRADFADRELFTNDVPRHIQRNEDWRVLWREYYPKTVSVMPVTKETVVAANQGMLHTVGTTISSDPEQLLTKTAETLPRNIGTPTGLLSEFEDEDDEEDEEFCYQMQAGSQRLFSN